MLAEDTRAFRTGPEASSPGVPRRPPAPAFPVKKPSAAHPRQPPSRAKPVIAPHSVPQAGWTPPAARPPAPPHPAPASPTRQPTEYSRRPRAARGRRGGDERPGTPRGGGAADQGAGTKAGGRGRAPTPQRAVPGTLSHSAHARARTPRSRVSPPTNRRAS